MRYAFGLAQDMRQQVDSRRGRRGREDVEAVHRGFVDLTSAQTRRRLQEERHVDTSLEEADLPAPKRMAAGCCWAGWTVPCQ